jgi:YggT family protein
MGLVLALVSFVLLLLQILLIARVILDWAVTLAGPGLPGSFRSRLSVGVRAVTEPLLAPIRRVLPPLRIGGVGIDLAFIVLFLAIVIIRSLIG